MKFGISCYRCLLLTPIASRTTKVIGKGKVLILIFWYLYMDLVPYPISGNQTQGFCIY